MIPRNEHETALRGLLRQFPVVGIVGARQVGKTTLARRLTSDWPTPVHFFDLEDPTHEAALAEPKLALESLRGLIVIDEVQRRPELFPLLRVLADRRGGHAARFLVLGSASPDLLRQASETLAGRIAYYELPPFRANEVGANNIETLWLRGGFPNSFLAEDDAQSLLWRNAFIRTFLERDLPQLGFSAPAATMRRFWTMLAHYHGNRWSSAEPGRALGLTGPTINAWLDTLVDALIVRKLPPWYENLKKRQVKAPKIYIEDAGLLHALLGIDSREALMGHPKSGSSWEGFAMQEIIRLTGIAWEQCYHWATHQGAELDLLAIHKGQRIGFEFKRTSAPSMTRSMHSALNSLQLDRLFVVFPGNARFALHERVEATGLSLALAEGFRYL